jgi:uncharacterized membrane protein
LSQPGGALQTAAGAISGTFWGYLIGLLFTLPFPFLAPVVWVGVSAVTAGIGAATGALSGHFSDYGIDDEFIKQLSATMQNNGSALFILLRSATYDKVLPELGKYGGTVYPSGVSPVRAVAGGDCLSHCHHAVRHLTCLSSVEQIGTER